MKYKQAIPRLGISRHVVRCYLYTTKAYGKLPGNWNKASAAPGMVKVPGAADVLCIDSE